MKSKEEHYNYYSVEAVDMAERIWGKEALMKCAEITAFFYRMRAGLKKGVEINSDFRKEEWWLDKYKELKNSEPLPSQHKKLNSDKIKI